MESTETLYQKEFNYSFFLGALTILVGFVWKEVLEAGLEHVLPTSSRLTKSVVVAIVFTGLIFYILGYINKDRSRVATKMHYIRNK
jgi:hypothetical protein